MIKAFARWTVLALSLVPVAVSAEPIKLKFSYFSSDATVLYQTAVKPFADAVNAAAKDQVEIEVHFSGSLGSLPQQAQIVRDGKADLAFVVPGITPELFPDNAVIDMPGLFRDGREATTVYTRMVAANLLKRYDEFVVIGTFATPLETIHTRMPITSLSDLKDKRIRANNTIKGGALEKLGMTAVLMPVNQAADAIAGDKLDGVAIPPAPLFDFGIGRITTNHYLLGVGVAPLVVLMNREKFKSLPAAAQDVIRKFSGEWIGSRFSEAYEADNLKLIEKLKADSRRKVVFPSSSDLAFADRAFQQVASEWAAKDQHNTDLYAAAKREIEKVRARGEAVRPGAR